MQPSPLYLKQLYFKHVIIHPVNENDHDLIAEDFDFDGVIIHEGIKIERMAPTADDQIPIYLVGLRILIKNEGGKKCPYTIDVEMVGFIEILKKNLSDDEMEKLALINGCSILYGAMRELVMNFTSRCAGGILVLPTVNFLDRKKETSLHQSKELSKPPSKKRVSTKTKEK